MKWVYVIARLVSQINLRSYINLYNFCFISLCERSPIHQFSFPTAAQNKGFWSSIGTMFGTICGTIPSRFWILFRWKKGRRFLPVPWAQHLIKRYKYEFLPHPTSGIEKFLLDPTAVSHCADGIWKLFSLLTAPQPLHCEMSWLLSGFMLY